MSLVDGQHFEIIISRDRGLPQFDVCMIVHLMRSAAKKDMRDLCGFGIPSIHWLAREQAS